MVEGVVRRMKLAREGQRISREEAAYRLKVDFSTIGRWERFESKDGPPLWAVAGYARLTGTPLVELLGENATAASLDAALMQLLFDRLHRFDDDMAAIQAQVGEMISRRDVADAD